jgi:large subunit ribosomal protein L29
MRELSADELKSRVDDTRKELIELRFQMAARKLESTAKLRQSRRRLAQLLTVQTERESR